MISAAEMASIQATAASWLDLSCAIRRKTTTPGTMGQPTASYSTVQTLDAGMSQPTGGQLANYAYLIGSLAAWQVRFPVGTDVREQDQLVINGQTLTVQIALSPRSFPGLLTVLASEVKQ